MAARRTELVKQDPALAPGLRGEQPLEPELLDDSTQQLRTQDLREIQTKQLPTQEQGQGLPSPEDILAEPPDARDIGAELAAPPRRKLPWLSLLLAGGVIAAAGFAGGALVEKNNGSSSNSAASAFAKLRSGATGGAGGTAGAGGFSRAGGTAGAGGAAGAAGAGGFAGFGGGAAGGATTGTVKLVDGNTIYVTNSSGNIVKITTGSSTTVSIAQSGKVSQIAPGQTVTVRGTTDSSGNVTATSVTEGGTTTGGAAG